MEWRLGPYLGQEQVSEPGTFCPDRSSKASKDSGGPQRKPGTNLKRLLHEFINDPKKTIVIGYAERKLGNQKERVRHLSCLFFGSYIAGIGNEKVFL